MSTKPTKKAPIEQEEIKQEEVKQEDTIEQQEDIQEVIDNSSTTKRLSLAAATGLDIDSDLVKYYADQF